MLNVDFMRWVPGKGQIEPVQSAFLLIFEQLGAIQEIRRLMLFAKEKPVSSGRPFQRALLQEGPERRQARAWPHHNDVRRVVCWQAEGARFLYIDRNIFHEQLRVIGEKAGGQALLGASMGFVADNGNAKEGFVRVGLQV